MGISDERLQILKMIEEGTITAQEGAELLRSLGQQGDPDPAAAAAAVNPRWLRVSITDINTGRQKVKINVPIGLVNIGMKMGARFAPDMDNAEYEVIMEAIEQASKTGERGMVVDKVSDDGEHVKIFVE